MDVPLVECMFLVSAGMPGESYCMRLWSFFQHRVCVTSFERLLTPLFVDSA